MPFKSQAQRRKFAEAAGAREAQSRPVLRQTIQRPEKIDTRIEDPRGLHAQAAVIVLTPAPLPRVDTRRP